MKTVKSGQKIQIEFKDTYGEKHQILSSVKAISDGVLVVNYADEFLQFASCLEEGTEILAYIFTGPNIKILDSIVMTSPNKGTIEIEFPEDYETIQRRAYVREDISCDVTIQSDVLSIDTDTLDLGGGGFRFNTDTIIEQNDITATIIINLNDNKPPVKCIGKISKKNHFAPEEYLVEFIEIAEIDRNRIIQKCIQFQTQKMREERQQEFGIIKQPEIIQESEDQDKTEEDIESMHDQPDEGDEISAQNNQEDIKGEEDNYKN